MSPTERIEELEILQALSSSYLPFQLRKELVPEPQSQELTSES